MLAGPPEFDYDRLAHPPATFRQEKLKGEVRLPAARRYIVERGLNESFGPAGGEVGLIVQGGLHNNLVRALQTLGLANALGDTGIPTLVLNVVHPLVPDEITRFCAGKRAVLDVFPELENFSAPKVVIWAGVDEMEVEPRVAVSFVADNFGPARGEFSADRPSRTTPLQTALPWRRQRLQLPTHPELAARSWHPGRHSAAKRPASTQIRDRKSTRLNSSHMSESRMPSSA